MCVCSGTHAVYYLNKQTKQTTLLRSKLVSFGRTKLLICIEKFLQVVLVSFVLVLVPIILIYTDTQLVPLQDLDGEFICSYFAEKRFSHGQAGVASSEQRSTPCHCRVQVQRKSIHKR